MQCIIKFDKKLHSYVKKILRSLYLPSYNQLFAIILAAGGAAVEGKKT